MSPESRRLPPEPQLAFDETGLILGAAFNDSYFSRDNGLEEARCVFLAGCGLPAGWNGRDHFTLAELGFGTGLNFLATWQAWRATRQPHQILHVVSTEAFLMSPADAGRAHACWPELADLSARLLANWPVRAFGPQRIWFEEDGLCLTILIGPALDQLRGMDFAANAWFLDGFAPSRNTDMWSLPLLAEVARLSAPGARAATYSVAGHVRRTLAGLGFEVYRQPGFGTKRERLEAIWPGPASSAPPRPKSALIIGGGIAGAAACHALARRQITPHLIDADPWGQTKASGNPAALIMPRLDRGDTREARFFRAAYVQAVRLYQSLGEDAFAATGVVEWPEDGRDQARLADLAENPPLPPDWLIPGPQAGLVHRTGGLAYPDRLLPALSQSAIRHPVHVASLEASAAGWTALDAQGAVLAQADICIVAAGPNLLKFLSLDLTLEGLAGQISLAPLTGALPDSAVAGGPYAAAFHGQLLFGATFDPWSLDEPRGPTVSLEAHARNQASLAKIAPELANRLDLGSAYGRASVRLTTSDRMPLAGPIVGRPGLYCLGGLGSRGFTTAPYLAEHLVATACGEPSPLDRAVALAVSPARQGKRMKMGQDRRPPPEGKPPA